MTNVTITRQTVHAHFFICTNLRPLDSPLPSCGQRDSAKVLQAFQNALAERGYPQGVKVTASGCLTPCQNGPNVVVYPEQTWYANVTESDVDEIIRAHLDQHTIVERLLLPRTIRIS